MWSGVPKDPFHQSLAWVFSSAVICTFLWAFVEQEQKERLIKRWDDGNARLLMWAKQRLITRLLYSLVRLIAILGVAAYGAAALNWVLFDHVRTISGGIGLVIFIGLWMLILHYNIKYRSLMARCKCQASED